MLTDAQIKTAKPRSKPYRLGDSGGLFIWISPSGGKLWRFKYRFDGKEKLMAFGKYPDVPLVEARRRHLESRRLLAAGADPMAKRKADRIAARIASDNSFESVAGMWHDQWKAGKSPRHADVIVRRMKADLFPALGAKPISEIEPMDLVRVAKGIERRGASDLAKRALQTTGQIFRFAIAHGYAKRNPAAEIKPGDILKATKKTNLARIDAKELPQLLRTLEVYQGTHVTRLAVKFMALTFVRTNELIGAQWTEFDFGACRWNIPKERMKMKDPHIVPLAPQAIELLETLRALTGNSKWLFPGDRNPRRPMSNNTILKALERMGYKGVMTGHGFRGLASTVLHEQGYPHDHIELQLAHAERNAVSGAYNHALYLEPRTKMMEDWANFLEETQRKGKILPFRKGVA